jgi:hypothetical protein
VIENDNGPCLVCHVADATGPLADPAEEGLAAEHAYLRHPDLHLRNTRCIDCHTELEHPVAHDLLTGRAAHQGCAFCHSRESVLMGRLYRYSSAPTRSLGFSNPATLADG